MKKALQPQSPYKKQHVAGVREDRNSNYDEPLVTTRVSQVKAPGSPKGPGSLSSLAILAAVSRAGGMVVFGSNLQLMHPRRTKSNPMPRLTRRTASSTKKESIICQGLATLTASALVVEPRDLAEVESPICNDFLNPSLQSTESPRPRFKN